MKKTSNKNDLNEMNILRGLKILLIKIWIQYFYLQEDYLIVMSVCVGLSLKLRWSSNSKRNYCLFLTQLVYCIRACC